MNHNGWIDTNLVHAHELPVDPVLDFPQPRPLPRPPALGDHSVPPARRDEAEEGGLIVFCVLYCVVWWWGAGDGEFLVDRRAADACVACLPIHKPINQTGSAWK